jgi:hypothetical protein
MPPTTMQLFLIAGEKPEPLRVMVVPSRPSFWLMSLIVGISSRQNNPVSGAAPLIST